MTAVGTRELTQYINDRGQRLWEVKLVIPTGTTGTIKQSQNIGLNGLLQTIAIVAPDLVAATTCTLYLHTTDDTMIALKSSIPDNGMAPISAMDLMHRGDKESGNGLPVFSGDYINIHFVTAQTGESLDFEVILRGI